MNCRHCQKRKASKPRGLCGHCYRVPAIRKHYPVTNKWASGMAQHGEPTEGELDLLIEERRRELPAWWESSGLAAERMRR